MIKFTSIDGLHIVARYGKKFIQNRVKFRGTTKLHGTNCSVVCLPDKLQPQSRNREISLQDDNAGFATFILETEERQNAIRCIESFVRAQFDIKPNEPLTIYGEWIGCGIQNGVAINKLPERQWVVFAIKRGEGEDSQYLDYSPVAVDYDLCKKNNIRSIYEAPIYEMEIDFRLESSIQKAVEETEKLTKSIEECCPWGKLHGIEGMGEGIVWIPLGKDWGNTDLFFKTKGEKHKTVEKSKRNKSILDPEVIESVDKFVEYSMTENRLKQGLDFLQEMGKSLDMQSVGDFLKWIGNDIQRECRVELQENELQWKQVSKAVNNKALNWYKEKLFG